jgi:hypothetical protein
MGIYKDLRGGKDGGFLDIQSSDDAGGAKEEPRALIIERTSQSSDIFVMSVL